MSRILQAVSSVLLAIFIGLVGAMLLLASDSRFMP